MVESDRDIEEPLVWRMREGERKRRRGGRGGEG